jgi:hypothetical protein
VATKAGGSLIELDVVALDGLASIRQIVKQPEEPPARSPMSAPPRSRAARSAVS